MAGEMRKHTSDGLGEKVDVRLLVLCHDLEVLVEFRAKASFRELLLGEVLESLAVEGVLEVLERQSVVEDDIVGDGCRLALDDQRRGIGHTSSCAQRKDGIRVLHLECGRQRRTGGLMVRLMMLKQ